MFRLFFLFADFGKVRILGLFHLQLQENDAEQNDRNEEAQLEYADPGGTDLIIEDADQDADDAVGNIHIGYDSHDRRPDPGGGGFSRQHKEQKIRKGP